MGSVRGGTKAPAKWCVCLLVGGFNPSEKYEFVSWKYYSQYMEKYEKNKKCSKPPISLYVSSSQTHHSVNQTISQGPMFHSGTDKFISGCFRYGPHPPCWEWTCATCRRPKFRSWFSCWIWPVVLPRHPPKSATSKSSESSNATETCQMACTLTEFHQTNPCFTLWVTNSLRSGTKTPFNYFYGPFSIANC